MVGLALAQNETRESHDRHGDPNRDGMGKFYLGREIFQVMGHLGVGWLERSSREEGEKPAAVIDAMDLDADAVVADVGAGSGYFTFCVARVIPDGEIWAVDIQPEMVQLVRTRLQKDSVRNVVPHLGKVDHPQLPQDHFDAVLMVDAYHEFSYPYEMMQGIFKALKPGGRVFLVEYRGEDPRIPIKPLHKMTVEQARKEITRSGFAFVVNRAFLPKQHFMVFEKPMRERRYCGKLTVSSKVGDDEMNAQVMCHWCGKPTQIIWVHGHGQCVSCGINIVPCCDGGICDVPVNDSDDVSADTLVASPQSRMYG